MNFELIATNEELASVAEDWRKSPEIGIDIECENNLHHYGTYVAVIQISTKDKNYIVDVLAITDYTPLVDVLEDKGIQKIFHDVGFDLRLLNKGLDCRPKHIFDTQMAALLLGKKHLGLGALLEEYMGVKKEKKFQMADWTKRPMTKDMLSYAVIDTCYLIKLRDLLMKEIKAKDRVEWVEEECSFIEDTEWLYREGTFMDVKGIRDLDDRQRAILKRLFSLRDSLAKRVDRPVHFVISTKKLMELVQKLPRDWRKVTQVHPIVKQKAHLFADEVKLGLQEKVPLPPSKKGRFTLEQKAALEQLGLMRNSIAEKLGIAGHLIMNKDQMQDIVLTGNHNSLRKWQRNLVEGV